VADLLFHGGPEVGERRVAQTVEVEKEVVEVEPLRTVERAGAPRPLADAGGNGGVTFEGFGVVLVIGAVVLPPVRADERGVEVRHRVVRLLRRRGRRRRAPLAGRRRVEPSAKVRVDRLPRVLEVADRLSGDVLDDRLQVPASPPSGRNVGRRVVRHAEDPASPAL
jgi:hypothetical protein